MPQVCGHFSNAHLCTSHSCCMHGWAAAEIPSATQLRVTACAWALAFVLPQVTTVGSPTWEAAPAGAGHAAGLQPPTPLRHPATPANGSSSRLQDWLFGRTNNTTSALPLPATSGSSSGGGDSSSTGDSSRSVFGGDARPAERQGASSWLATGSNWAEVVQVRPGRMCTIVL
jgi:hypothetical protein